MSLDARGKLGGCLVFMGWKGIKTVRQWLTPANPQSIGQGDIRVAIGGLGRAVAKIGLESDFHEQLKTLELIPDHQSKQSYMVQYIKDNYFAGTGATFTAAYVAMLAELTGHTAYADWTAAAASLSLVAFDLDYAGIAPFDNALGIYLMAKAAIALEFTTTPYTLALASWTATGIAVFTGDLQAA